IHGFLTLMHFIRSVSGAHTSTLHHPLALPLSIALHLSRSTSLSLYISLSLHLSHTHTHTHTHTRHSSIQMSPQLGIQLRTNLRSPVARIFRSRYTCTLPCAHQRTRPPH